MNSLYLASISVSISLPLRTCTYGFGRVGEPFESVSGSVPSTFRVRSGTENG